MYLEHYRFQQLPFRNTPDPRFFFDTPRHSEALANLIYAVEQRRGFVLLSGEIGSGKTLVTHLLLQHLEDHAQIALIRNTHLNTAQLIRLICDEYSVHVHAQADKAAMLLALNSFLIQQLAEDRLVVVIIDEAQNLSDKVLEELRMLSNLETSSDKLLQIVLVGQPELRDKVSQPHLEQLRQRIALSYHLEPLTLEEIGQYIQHRMRVAGPEHLANFTPEAVAKISRFSRGTPRIINGLCDNALLYGFTAGTHTLDEQIIDRVLKHSMHLVPRQHMPMRSPQAMYGGRASLKAAEKAAARNRRNPDEAPEVIERPASPISPVREAEPVGGQERIAAPEASLADVALPPPPNLDDGATQVAPAAEEAVGSPGEANHTNTAEAAAAELSLTQDDADKKKESIAVPPIIPFPTLKPRPRAMQQ